MCHIQTSSSKDLKQVCSRKLLLLLSLFGRHQNRIHNFYASSAFVLSYLIGFRWKLKSVFSRKQLIQDKTILESHKSPNAMLWIFKWITLFNSEIITTVLCPFHSLNLPTVKLFLYILHEKALNKILVFSSSLHYFFKEII